MFKAPFKRTAFALLAAGLLVAATVSAQDEGPLPLSPQPAGTALKPGIAVTYYYNFVRHIDELRRWMTYKEGIPGDPITMLNYNVGEDPMLTSTRSKGLGAHMTGAIYFEQAGSYSFSAMSNDGFELSIGGAVVLQDPEVHYDRMTDVVRVEIPTPGWYALEMHYFQRKGTARLELFWRPPWDKGDGEMSHVPAEVFAHIATDLRS